MKNSNQISPPRSGKTDWWLYPVPVLLTLTLIFYIIVQSRPGSLGVVIFYLGPLLVVLLTVILLIIGIIYSIIKRPFFSVKRIAGFTGLVSICFSGFLYNKYPSSYDNRPSRIAFRIPTDSALSVAWGGGIEEENYHVVSPSQCWAYDLMVIKNGQTYNGDEEVLENYFCYGLTLRSPAAGTVIAAVDKFPNVKIADLSETDHPTGNHIVLQVAEKEFLFMAHLKPGSVKVKAGEVVKQGQEIAAIGNSGHTSEPHLHMHLQNTSNLVFGEGIPLYFAHYLSNNKYVERGLPRGGFDESGNWKGQTIQNVNDRNLTLK